MVEIEVTCADCDFEEEYEVSEMPVFCPECHGRLKRKSEPSTPTDTTSDKV